ncbi:hypothetical protein F442_15119 [Phytophthora nicotianae P10297]|uniref:Uncharacterized protein n=2 Tax=Phytophthora nicotianae TaxID=4792 RepID=W2YPZ2_PHYNI|nr:hypothetical protein F444_15273 [Phytophthora nicotianae P1976]ETP37036.1 hypothetical protein F442_15119 [Phytophthora nicotianae P10297]
MKEIVNSSMALDECLASIICYQTRAEQLLYDRACKVSMVHHEGYDREMNLLANLVSKRVCSLIHEQYMYAIGSALYTFYETTPGVISIKNDAENEDSLDEPRFEIFEELSSTLPATQPKGVELHKEEVTQCSTESCNTAATIVMTVSPPSAELSVDTVDQSVM